MSRAPVTVSSLALLIAAFISIGCDPGPRGVGVVGVKNAAGQLAIGVKTCDPAARITNVMLETSGSKPGILWDIHSDTGSQLGLYVAGKLPPDYSERVPLVGELIPDKTYLIIVEVRDAVLHPSVEFRSDRLSTETWRIDTGQVVTEAEFAKLGRCN